MVFSSFVFLMVFLPVVLIAYYCVPKKVRNFVLLITSLIFYAWGEPKYVLIMLFSTVFDYTNGRIIGYYLEQGRQKRAKAVLAIDVCGNLAILGFFKYADFMLENLNYITGAGISLLKLALPIGISFYTFQTMSYTIDVYRKVVEPQKNIISFATYVTLFPQLIAGPIVQYKTVADELSNRRFSIEDFSEGAFRFVLGLSKKVILANQIGALWTEILAADERTVATAWLGAVAYTFQIYFDFSGYSDMAIGLGRMFGFHFLENFNFPYMSKSITEFWRRWHISLSTWFREYVYIPLGGNRKGNKRQLFNLLVVWFLTGFWHGASWNFVLWGFYYGILLILEKSFLLRWLEKVPKMIRHFYTIFFVVFGWVIFAQTNLKELGDYIGSLFGVGVSFVNGDFWFYLRNNMVLLIVLILCSIDYKKYLKGKSRYQTWVNSGACDICKIVIMVVLFMVSFAFLVGESYNPFLYFRF